MEFELREQNYTSLNQRLNKWGKFHRFERSAWNMYMGDHWDEGRGYIGPLPNINDATRDSIYRLIHQAFTSRNVVAEVVDRAIDGLLGRAPNWKVYNQEELMSRSIEAAQKRLDIQKKATEAIQSTVDMVNSDNPQLPSPKQGDAQGLQAKNVNGNIEVNATNDPNKQGTSEIVNKKEVEAEIILGKLWTDLNLKQVLTDVFSQRMVTGRSNCRLYIPKKFADGTAKVEGLLDAVKGVRAEHIDKSSAKVIDEDGERISITKLEKSKNSSKVRGVEVSFVNDDDGKTYLLVYEPDNQKSSQKNDKNSEIENLNEENTDAEDLINELKKIADVSEGIFLDGNLLTEEICGKPYVNDQLLQNNRALNLALTLAVNVLIEDGFTEMITTNAAIEYVNMPDPNNPGGTVKVAKTLQRGSNRSMNIVGVQSFDDKGAKTYSDPTFGFREPTPLDSFDKGEQLYYRQCLGEGKQIFVLISADSLSSGESRVQARQDFLNEIMRFKPDIDKLGGWILTTLLHLVAKVAGKDEYFKGIGVTFDARVTAGDLSSDEKNVVISRYDKGLISRENAMVLLGSEDPILELDAIRADEAEKQMKNAQALLTTSKFATTIQADKQANPNDPSLSKKPEVKPAAAGK